MIACIGGWQAACHVRHASGAEEILETGTPSLRVGSAPGNGLVLQDPAVSRIHFELCRDPGRLVLRDLGSTNGTILNGRPLHGAEAEVRDGDRFRIGPLSFALAVGPAPARSIRIEPPDDHAMPPADEVTDATEEFLSLGGEGGEIGLKTEVIEGVLVITPLLPTLDGEREIDAFRDVLLSMLDRRFPRRVVINLDHVGHLSGRAIGILVAHHLRLDRSGGALRLCLTNPRVAAILEHVRLGMLVDCHPSVDDAIVSAWPGVAAEALTRS